jgi:hypothetical protein
MVDMYVEIVLLRSELKSVSVRFDRVPEKGELIQIYGETCKVINFKTYITDGFEEDKVQMWVEVV